jgi:hypothetical protein
VRLRHVGTLIANDLKVHGPAIGLTDVLMLAFIWFASRFRKDAEALFLLVFNLNFLMALLWGDWLISREKLKGTFGWLRTLPVSDRDLVAAKFLTAAVCGTTLWTSTTLLFARGYFPGRSGIATWIVLLLSLLVCTSVSVGVRWRFTQKLGVLVPGALVLAPVLLLFGAKRQGWDAPRMLQAFWEQPLGKAAAAAALIATAVLVFLVTERWVRRSDTFRLLE